MPTPRAKLAAVAPIDTEPAEPAAAKPTEPAAEPAAAKPARKPRVKKEGAAAAPTPTINIALDAGALTACIQGLNPEKLNMDTLAVLRETMISALTQLVAAPATAATKPADEPAAEVSE